MAPEPEPAPNPAPETQSQSDQTATTEPQQQQQQQSQETPASPPLPTRHTALTPGPRASRFQATLDSALSHTLAKISWDNFAACYPHIAAHAPATLRAVQSQMVDRLRSLCKKEFDSIQQTRSVVAKLNELETLVSEAERRRKAAGDGGGDPPIPIWKTRGPVRSPIAKPDTARLVVGSVTTSESLVFPHTLPPDEVLDAHLAPHLAQQQSQLNAKLQTTQAHNAKLYEDIKLQRAEIESLVSLLEKVLGDVTNTNQMMDGIVDDAARETRAIEIEMAES